MGEHWRRLTRLLEIYRHVKRYVDEADYIEQACGHFPESDLNRLIMQYGREALVKLRMQAKIVGGEPMEQPGLLVGNHASYVDMPLLMSQSPVQFVAKHEVRHFPIMGSGAEKAGTIFVKRGKKHSRRDTGYAVANGILRDKKRVVIFPSGTTTVDENTPWRWGPFRIAAEHDLWLQPFRLRYFPLNKVAYIGKDFFPYHLWQLLDHEHLTAEIEYADPIKITDPEQATATWQAWAREFVTAGASHSPQQLPQTNANLEPSSLG